MKPQAASPHWAQIGESTFVGGMWLLYQVHRWLGRWPFLACLYPVVKRASPSTDRPATRSAYRMAARDITNCCVSGSA